MFDNNKDFCMIKELNEKMNKSIENGNGEEFIFFHENIMKIYYNQRKFDEMEKLCKKQLKLVEKFISPIPKIYIMEDIGKIYEKNYNYSKAIEIFKSTIKMLKKIRNNPYSNEFSRKVQFCSLSGWISKLEFKISAMKKIKKKAKVF